MLFGSIMEARMRIVRFASQGTIFSMGVAVRIVQADTSDTLTPLHVKINCYHIKLNSLMPVRLWVFKKYP